jgi:Domain of unknown function (DUF4340)
MARKATSTSKAAPRKPRSSSKETKAKRQKPVLPVGTLVTLVLFAGLITLAIYVNKQKETTAKATPTGQPAPVFSEADGAPSSIEVKPATGDTVKVTRNAANAWAIEAPFAAEADQGLAEAAATQVTSLRILDRIDANPSIFGFDNPSNVITIDFAAGKKHVLEIGDPTPSNSGYYVRLDGDKMFIVSLTGIDPLLNLAAFPPYLNTPTPSALPPTEAPVSPTEAVSTPTP